MMFEMAGTILSFIGGAILVWLGFSVATALVVWTINTWGKLQDWWERT
jgi:hypothetical protein